MMPRRVLDVSIHAFRGEGDTSGCCRCIFTPKFQSTPSGGKATGREERSPGKRGVSIHAFRGEGDSACVHRVTKQFRVSIHAFRGEGDALQRGED